MVNITIDGKPYTVKDGITLIEAIDQAKIGLPRYCYHPGLSIAGNCRICQVEVEKMPRTVIACNTLVTEGMVIHTQSQKAKESQQVVLEFLLVNHPLDCPVCDQSGECKLQDYYMDYGLYDPKFNENKVKKTKKAKFIGPTATPPLVLESGEFDSPQANRSGLEDQNKTSGGVMLDQERCILCSRCVRFTDEITKTHELGIFNRGDHAEVDVYPGKMLDNKYSGNVVDICPVGALTDKDFRFKMRVWYLGSQESICPGCSRGCNINIEYETSRPYHLKDERVMRLKPRENKDVNRWWICDEGRYAYKSIDQNRIQKIKEGTWTEALFKIASLIKTGHTPDSWALLASPQHTNEELYLQKKIFKDTLKWKYMAFKAPNQDGYEDNFLIKKDKNPNTAGARQILGLAKESEDVIPPPVSCDRKAIGSLSANETGGGMTLIVEKAKRGELEGLFIFQHDLEKIYGAETLKIVRQKVKTIVYEGSNENPTAAAADFVLPSASYAEKEGTFTNFEGRVQRIRKALEPIGLSKATWQILLELGVFLGSPFSYTKPEAIFNDLAKENEAYRDLSYKKIGSSGVVWNKTK